MGEYVKLHGHSVKLGTCEDLYYVRFKDMQNVAGMAQKMEGNLDPKEYLNPKHGWRYRFPFPEEDNKQAGSYEDYDKGRMFSAPPGSAFMLSDAGHSSITCSIHPKGGGWNVNYRVPCPASGKADGVALSAIPDAYPLEIIQQKQMEDGALWAVLRCAWCQEAYRLIEDEAIALAAYLRTYEDHNKEYWNKVADRILAGYERAGALQSAQV